MALFISYAQNFEDVILHRALADVERGFYVDVGAQHPLRDSVTRAFYERGWRGINIEPVNAWHGLLEVDRPQDTNLRVVVGAEEGEAVFYEVHDSGLSTTDHTLAMQHAVDGYTVSKHVVPRTTLNRLLEGREAQPIHFLKIDVEGSESEVLRGLSFDRVRPWIVVVEATRPNTQADVSEHWNPLLEEAGYRVVYDDGLNRFYLANEQERLRPRFSRPPNIFDQFVRHSDWECAEGLRRATQALQERERELESASTELRVAQASQDDMGRLAEENLSLRGNVDGFLTRLQAATDEVQACRKQIAIYRNELRLSRGEVEDARRQHDEVLADNAELRSMLQTADDRVLGANQLTDQGRQALAHAEERMRLLLASRSWRLTRPLRAASSWLGASRPFPVAASMDSCAGAKPGDAVVSHKPASAVTSIPDEARLLALASDAGAQAPATAQGATHSMTMVDDRLLALISELRAFSTAPVSLPPSMKRIAGSSAFAAPLLRVYERLFRRQAFFNSKIVEALTIMRDRER